MMVDLIESSPFFQSNGNSPIFDRVVMEVLRAEQKEIIHNKLIASAAREALAMFEKRTFRQKWNHWWSGGGWA